MDMQQVKKKKNNKKKWIYRKKKNKTMKTDGCSGIYKIIYHNGSYLLLIGKTQWQSLEIPHE